MPKDAGFKLTTNNINPTVIVSAIRDALEANSILVGSGYLGGSGKVYSNRKPTSAECPYIVIECKDINYMSQGQFSTEARIFVYTAILANGQISAISNLILYQCQTILNDNSLSITGMSVISMTTAIVPTFFDEEADESKARGVLRVKLDLGYTS